MFTQGGVVVGAIVPRVVVPLSDSIMLWLQEGGWNAQLVALLVAGSFSALTLFPLPINASGDVFRDALSCYHRTAVLVTFMLSFVVGKLMLAADAVEAGSLGQGPGASGEAGATALAAPSTAPLAAARMLLGLTLALVAVELVSRTVRVCVQALLQVNHTAPKERGRVSFRPSDLFIHGAWTLDWLVCFGMEFHRVVRLSWADRRQCCLVH